MVNAPKHDAYRVNLLDFTGDDRAAAPQGLFLVVPQEIGERRALRGDAECRAPARQAALPPHKEPLMKHSRTPSGIFPAWTALKNSCNTSSIPANFYLASQEICLLGDNGWFHQRFL